MLKKAPVFLFAALVLGPVYLAEAQQPGRKVPRIGFLSNSNRSDPFAGVEAFRQRLRELGYIEGRNLTIEYRFAEGKLDRLPDLAAELVGLKVDVIVTGGNESIRASSKATRTVPIVMVFSGNPVESGFVASLSRPGGNITGLTSISQELMGKRLEILKEVLPQVSHVAILRYPGNPLPGSLIKEMKDTGQALGLRLQLLEVRDPKDFESAFSKVSKDLARALAPLPDGFMNIHRQRIVELAAKYRLPAIYTDARFAQAGGLMSYGAVRSEEGRRAADYVDRILKGAKPASLPVEQPMKFELVINLKTARQIGLTIPPNVLARADRVIK